MKELSIEGNAYDGNYKAYTELINRLEDVKNAIKKQNYGIAIDILCKPYPEYQITTSTGFKESEGLRIIKAIKYGLDHVFTNNTTVFEVTKEQCLAWIEKQCEHSNFLSKIQVGDKVTRNEDGVLVNLSQLNRVAKKQGEQKPADKVEPKFHEGDIIKPKDGGHEPWQIMQVDIFDKKYRFKDGYVIHFSQEDDYELVEQKPAWSEEDEKQARQIERIVHNDGCAQKLQKQIADWFKSLKDRVQPQPKQEWSEEDINMIDWLIRCCEKEHEELCNDRYGHQDIVSDLKRDCRKKWDWLESLKERVAPQSHWKPSEGQLECLGNAIDKAEKDYPTSD